MPLLESFGVLAEIGGFLIEIFKAARAGVSFHSSREGFKIISTLTTLEFRQEHFQQVAHFVQDRHLVFTKSGALPPFTYWSEGQNVIDELLVDNIPYPFRLLKNPGELPQITLENEMRYEKGHEARETLVAHSIGGYLNKIESYNFKIERWVGRSSLAIIIPDDKKPSSFRLYYRRKLDAQNVRRNTAEKCELKKTTCGRWVLFWEFKNLKPDLTFTLEWEWGQQW
jgi:hypothetical protein